MNISITYSRRFCPGTGNTVVKKRLRVIALLALIVQVRHELTKTNWVKFCCVDLEKLALISVPRFPKCKIEKAVIPTLCGCYEN